MATLVSTTREATSTGTHVTNIVTAAEKEADEEGPPSIIDYEGEEDEDGQEEEETGQSLHAKGVAMFRGGGVVKQDMAGAVALWELAVKNYAHVASSVCLGMALWHGEGATKDTARAKEMLRKAGKDGGKEGAQAAYFLGMAYLSGDPGLGEEGGGGDDGEDNNKDPSRAARWFRQAAKHNHAEAHYQLGAMLMGSKDADSLRKACDWLTSAADLGHVRAKEFLASANKATTTVQPTTNKAGSGPSVNSSSSSGGLGSGSSGGGTNDGGAEEDNDWLVGVVPSGEKKKGGGSKKGGNKNKKKGGR